MWTEYLSFIDSSIMVGEDPLSFGVGRGSGLVSDIIIRVGSAAAARLRWRIGGYLSSCLAASHSISSTVPPITISCLRKVRTLRFGGASSASCYLAGAIAMDAQVTATNAAVIDLWVFLHKLAAKLPLFLLATLNTISPPNQRVKAKPKCFYLWVIIPRQVIILRVSYVDFS